MSFSTQDIEILRKAKAEGKTKEQALGMLAMSRQGTSSPATQATQTTAPSQKPSVLDRITGGAKKVTSFLGMDAATDVFGRAIARTDTGAAITGTDANANREFIKAPTGKELAGATLQTAATAAAPAIPVPAGFAAKVLAGAAAGYAYDIGQKMAEGQDNSEIIKPGAGAIIGAIAPGAGPLGAGASRVAGAAAKKAGQAVTNSPVVKGALQTGIEFAERVPRFISKKNVEIRDAATRAQRIATAPPPIANAIKSGVDERIINTVEQADPATRSGYRDIVRLAEESVSTTGTLKTTARPEIVAGDAAAQQYKLIDDQRKKVGQAIGERVKGLSKDTAVDMQPAYSELDSSLQDIGVGVKYTPNGVSLDFGKTGFSQAQRTKINELYKLATEGGSTLTPAQVHAKDRLFSQLQRETRMDGIGDVLVDTPDGQVSLFRVFRDVYSDTLEAVDPDIRALNRQYRNLSTFTDDIENSLLKTGKFETNSKVDPAEYAQTNLRRLFSEASSAADYRAIADEMDNASRALGYEGAKPEELARFAYEIRKIYPETTPRTGFEGASRFSVGGALDAVMSAGKADLSDQQKALRELLEALSESPQL
jgi:hypothetical protein